MQFGLLETKNVKTFKIHAFRNIVLFLNYECYSWVSAFWYLRNFSIFRSFCVFALWFLWNYKTLIIHVSRNVLFYPDIECLFLSLSSSKTLKIYLFSNVILFLHFVLFAFLRKTLKRHVFSNFVLDSNIEWLILFIVSVPNMLKKTQKTCFW